MKIETLDPLETDNGVTLPLALMLHRIGDELHDISTTCKNVENALGSVISNPEKQIDQSIVAFQGLDRIRQTVEDLARLTRAVSRTHALSKTDIPVHNIDKSVVLTGLAERLSGGSISENDSTQRNQDVIWT